MSFASVVLWRLFLLAALLPAVVMARTAEDIVVRGSAASSCTLTFQGVAYRCALGKNGIAPAGEKKEGDMRTPTGRFRVRRGYYRQDRLAAPTSALDLTPLQPSDGWCDDSSSADYYNKPISLPSAYSAEHLWREDGLYDAFAVIEYNTEPAPVPGAGSAIFFHVASDGYGPTAGCVSMALKDLLSVFSAVKQDQFIDIGLA